MQINNNIHYSRDPYLLSQAQYEAEQKTEEKKDEAPSDISSVKLEEKIYAKTVNALQSTSMEKIDEGNNPQALEKAIASYSEIESSQEQFNRVKETV